MTPLLHVATMVAVELFTSLFRSSAGEARIERVEPAGRGLGAGLSWLGMVVAMAALVWWVSHTGLPVPSIDVAGQLEGRR
jgi:hypothetical protein